MPVQAGAPIRATGLGRLFSFAWAICVSRGQEGCVREMTQEGAREEERTPCGRGVDKVVSNVGFCEKQRQNTQTDTFLFLLCTLRTRLNRAHAYIHQTDLKKHLHASSPLCTLWRPRYPRHATKKHTTCHCYSQNQCSTRAMTMSSSPRRHFINALLSGGLMPPSPLFLRQPMSRPHPKATMPSERSEKANSSLSRPVRNEREGGEGRR